MRHRPLAAQFQKTPAGPRSFVIERFGEAARLVMAAAGTAVVQGFAVKASGRPL